MNCIISMGKNKDFPWIRLMKGPLIYMMAKKGSFFFGYGNYKFVVKTLNIFNFIYLTVPLPIPYGSSNEPAHIYTTYTHIQSTNKIIYDITTTTNVKPVQKKKKKHSNRHHIGFSFQFSSWLIIIYNDNVY